MKERECLFEREVELYTAFLSPFSSAVRRKNFLKRILVEFTKIVTTDFPREVILFSRLLLPFFEKSFLFLLFMDLSKLKGN